MSPSKQEKKLFCLQKRHGQISETKKCPPNSSPTKIKNSPVPPPSIRKLKKLLAISACARFPTSNLRSTIYDCVVHTLDILPRRQPCVVLECFTPVSPLHRQTPNTLTHTSRNLFLQLSRNIAFSRVKNRVFPLKKGFYFLRCSTRSSKASKIDNF